MKYYFLFAIAAIFTSCSFIPELAKDAVEIADDTAVKVQISREAISENPNLDIDIKVSKSQQSKWCKAALHPTTLVALKWKNLKESS